MIWMKIGVCFSLLSVIIGAFGAHGIKDSLIKNDTVDVFNTSVKYHIFHSLAILITAILQLLGYLNSTIPIISFIIGILLFSGSLYILSYTGIKWLGAITPIGGIFFIIGWITLFIFLRSCPH